MAFERFVLGGKSYKPKVSIRRSGQIGFNQGAVKKFSMEKYRYAVLFFDRINKRIGIKLTNEEEEGICRLRVRGWGGTVSAKAFLDYYGIDYSRLKKFDARWDESEGMIVVDIKERK